MPETSRMMTFTNPTLRPPLEEGQDGGLVASIPRWYPRGTMTETLRTRFASRLRLDEPMASHTTLAVGGPADLFVEVESVDELVWLDAHLRESELPVFWMGGGSNLLVGDGGVRGVVAKVAIRGLRRGEGGRLVVGAGEKLSRLVRRSVAEGLGGLEVLAGIPGSVGGAVAGNAGAYGRAISDRCRRVRVLRGGQAIWLGRDALSFSYRNSCLRDRGEVILEAEFELEPVDGAALEDAVAEILEARGRKVPPASVASAGSWFKNLPPLEEGGKRRAAGWFLDQCGMKGQAEGAAEVWPDHANIVVNRGGASAADVCRLVARMADAVRERFAIDLEAEVRSVGDFGGRPA